jgi:hypothetical protein
MIVKVEINDLFSKHLQNVDIKSYINELIAKDIYFNSKQFEQDKAVLNKRLHEIEKGEYISHEDMWREIDEL